MHCYTRLFFKRFLHQLMDKSWHKVTFSRHTHNHWEFVCLSNVPQPRVSNMPSCHLLGWSQILQQDTVKIQYPVLHSTEVIECDCGNVLCDNVYWFRSIHNHEKLEFLGRFNNAGRGSPVDEAHFKLSRKSNTCFALFIINVTEEDTGIYSCVLKDRKNTETWKSGILLRPGGLCAETSGASFTALWV